MIAMSVTLEGDGAWGDLKDKPFIHLTEGAIEVAVLAGGMGSGQPSVALRFALPDGQTVIAETSARLFVLAALTIKARHPMLFVD